MHKNSRPTKADALAGAAAQGIEEISKSNGANSRQEPRNRQAFKRINGEHAAAECISRLQAQRIDAVSLAGVCRVIKKALGVRHG